MGGGENKNKNTNQGDHSNNHSFRRLATLPDSIWFVVDLLTPTSDFLKSWASIHHLVTSQKQLHGPKRGTSPREMAFLFNRQPSKDGQHLTPTCVNCQLPTTESTVVGMPLLSEAFITVIERSCSCGLDFKGFFAFDVNPSPPRDEHVPSVV